MELGGIRTRQDALDLLDGYSEQRAEGSAHAKGRSPLVKSYILETVPQQRQQKPLPTVLREAGCELIPLDESLYKVYDKQQGVAVGFLEALLPRFPVLYTTDESRTMDSWVGGLVRKSHALDRLWLSGRAFQELLRAVLLLAPNHRFGRLVFRHSNLFEGPDTSETAGHPDGMESGEDDADGTVTGLRMRDDDDYVPERRDTRFEVVDRLSELRAKLPALQGIYAPLYAISQLRFPARGPGGHDFRFDGKVTNRSSSFADHRQHIEFVIGMYKRATERTESSAWLAMEDTHLGANAAGTRLVGAPVRLQFSKPLDQGTFDRFITSAFGRKNDRFRLWGHPIRMGSRRIHVYGMDRHLWQPIFLEISTEHILAIIPEGTCGNTVHRLVTNVQHYLDPGVQVTIGGDDYSAILSTESQVGEYVDAH
jgi:hypothetical protein